MANKSPSKKPERNRIVLYFKPAELKAFDALAKKEAFRSTNQWIVATMIRTTILKS